MHVAALAGSVGHVPGFARSEAPGTAAPAAQQQPQEPFLSPVFRFDKQARVVIFEFRDSETGDVTRQYPSERVVKLYRDNAPPTAAGAPAGSGRETAEPAAREAPVEGTGTADTAAKPVVGTGGGGGEDRVRLTA